MKGYRFYLEYASPQDKRGGTVKNPGPHIGTVVALWLDMGYRLVWTSEDNVAAVAAVSSVPNSPVCGSDVGIDYLGENCRRVPERLAREIHPALFEYLEG